MEIALGDDVHPDQEIGAMIHVQDSETYPKGTILRLFGVSLLPSCWPARGRAPECFFQ